MPLTEAGETNKTAKISTNLVDLPLEYKSVMKEVIEYANTSDGEHLANILRSLQIHRSRISSLIEDFSPDSNMSVFKTNILGNIGDLSELAVLIERTFNYARGQDSIDNSSYEAADFIRALSIMDVRQDLMGEMRNISKSNAELLNEGRIWVLK